MPTLWRRQGAQAGSLLPWPGPCQSCPHRFGRVGTLLSLPGLRVGWGHLYSTHSFPHRRLGVLQRDRASQNAGPARKLGSSLAWSLIHLHSRPTGEAEAPHPSVASLETAGVTLASSPFLLWTQSSDLLCLALGPPFLTYSICHLLPLCASTCLSGKWS